MADRIQRELLRRLPGDPVIAEFSKYLPSEALAQRRAVSGEEGGVAEESYDEEEEEAAEKDEEYDKEEPEEPEEKEEDQQAEVVQEGVKP